MNKTPIEWTDYTWNPVTGCHKVSPGCKHCYAEVLTKRFGKSWGSGDFRDVKERPERLDEPMIMRKKLVGKKVFVCDMSDLFHESVSDAFINEVMVIISLLPDTTFQILTKRTERMMNFFNDYYNSGVGRIADKNLWIGTSCEDQKSADERIPFLINTPSLKRFLSCEPLLGPIDIFKSSHKQLIGYPKDNLGYLIKWIIVGGESGHGARPMHPDWARSLRDQCATANIPFFFKQWGEYILYPHMNDGIYISPSTGKHTVMPGTEYSGLQNLRIERLGKGKAGNLLDGVQHLNFPA